MIHFFRNNSLIFVLKAKSNLIQKDLEKLNWLFGGTTLIDEKNLSGYFIGPRKEMITPWSTNAVEITQNMGIDGIVRIEEFYEVSGRDTEYDPMLSAFYEDLGQDIFTIVKQPDPIIFIDDIADYNQKEGTALSDDEVEYLEQLAKDLIEN